MDSSRDDQNLTMDAIRAAIDSGDLSREEIMRRIRGAIGKEEMKPKQDRRTALLLMYEYLLYELRTGKPYVSRKEENKHKLFARLAAEEERSRKTQPIKRVASILAALLVLLMGGELVRRQWLSGNPSDDGQQYIIQGGKIDPSLIPGGQADPIPETRRMTITSLDEAPELLGFTPVYPTWLPEGWEFEQAEIIVSSPYTQIVVSFAKKNVEYLLKLEEWVYKDVDKVKASIQKDSYNNATNILDTFVYYTTNTKVPTCVWIHELTYVTIYGPVSESDLLSIAESVIKEMQK